MLRPNVHPLAVPLALLSAAVLAFEISLMRLLLVASWHHFAFVVLSVALLAFGASGTALALLRNALLPRADIALRALFVAAAVSMPLCVSLAGLIPIEGRFLPVTLWQQAMRWLLYWVVLGAPLLAGAMAIGLALMSGGRAVASLYAANLLGSGLGAAAAPAVMSLLPPEWLGHACSAVALAACAVLSPGAAKLAGRLALPAAGAAAALVCTIVLPPRTGGDPWKYSAHLKRLESQGWAKRLAVRHSARSTVELWRSDAFHDLPLLSGGVAPPPLDAIVMDGHLAGSLLRIGAVEQAAFLDDSMIAAAYDLAPRKPRVLLAGETGCANAWLAARRGAARIDIVQSDPAVSAIIRSRPPEEGSAVLRLPGVRIMSADPRHFAEHAGGEYDLIQLAGLETSPAGGGGFGGLAQDHLITVEGLAACLRRLAPDGVLVAARGMQSPPRDIPKLLATLTAALRDTGAPRPEDHLIVFRDFQWVCMLAARKAWSDEHVETARQVCRRRDLTPVWWRGIRDDELNQPDALPVSELSRGDGYYHAVLALTGPQRDDFIRRWPFDIRPPTDDRPFFRDFCRLRAVGDMRRALGDLWLTRAETAFLFVCAAALVIGTAALVFVLAPLAVSREVRCAGGKTATALYFPAIGLAYMLLETMAITRLTHLVGDGLYAASTTICAFLVFSGVGSAIVGRMRLGALGGAAIVVGTAAAALAFVVFQPAVTAPAGALPLAGRCVVAALVAAPAAVLMGMPMPLGLMRLQGGRAALFPWAWGLNGFASVLAAPLAMIVSMTAGFVWTGAAAAVLYALAACIMPALPDPQAES